MPILDHFGLIAPYYDRSFRPKIVERMIQMADLPATGRLLDAGGGTGRVAYELRNSIGMRVVADISLGMLRQAKAKNGLLTACAASEELPFQDGTFERVLMVDAFHHVGRQKNTAQELWRVLKPGGRLVIEEPDIRTLPVKLVALAEKLLLMRSHFKSPDQIEQLFHYPNAKTRIEREEITAWVIVVKGKNPD